MIDPSFLLSEEIEEKVGSLRLVGLLVAYRLTREAEYLSALKDAASIVTEEDISDGRTLLRNMISTIFLVENVEQLEELKDHLNEIVEMCNSISDEWVPVVMAVLEEKLGKKLNIDDKISSLPVEKRPAAKLHLRELEENAVKGWKYRGYDIQRLPAFLPEDESVEGKIDELVYRYEEQEVVKSISSLSADLLPTKIGKSILVGRRANTTKGFVLIGKVIESGRKNPANEAHENAPVLLDVSHPHVIFVCGQRGTGKSYTMGVLLEGIAGSDLNLGAVVIDPIGIFWSMKYPNRMKREVEMLEEWGLEPQGFDVRVFIPVGYYDKVPGTDKIPFAIAVSDLTVDDWCYMFDIDRFKQTGLLLERAIEETKKGYTANGQPVPGKEDYTIADLMKCIRDSDSINDSKTGFQPSTKRAILSRLQAATKWGIFSPQGTPLSTIIKPRIPAIIDVSFLEEKIRGLVIGILARKILQKRMEISRMVEDALLAGRTPPPQEIPPVWMFIDEAHLFAPKDRKTPALGPLIDYVKLGRKPGCSIVLATQQPGATDDRVLSQMDILISHALSLDTDIRALYRRAPAAIPDEFDAAHFRRMRRGMALIADGAATANRAFLIQIRPRQSQHAGRDTVVKSVAEETLPAPAPTEEKAVVEEALPPKLSIALEYTSTYFPPTIVANKLDRIMRRLLKFKFVSDWAIVKNKPTDALTKVLSKIGKDFTLETVDGFKVYYHPEKGGVAVVNSRENILVFVAAKGNDTLNKAFEDLTLAKEEKLVVEQPQTAAVEGTDVEDLEKRLAEIAGHEPEAITVTAPVPEIPGKEKVPSEDIELKKAKLKEEARRYISRMESILKKLESLDRYYSLGHMSVEEYRTLKQKALAKVSLLKQKIEEIKKQLKNLS